MISQIIQKVKGLSSLQIAGGVALVATIWLLTGIFTSHKEEDKKVLTVQETIPYVRVQTHQAVERTSTITMLGVTKAVREVQLKSETSGAVKEILVEEGRLVKKGDLIARIVLNDREAKLLEAESLLAQKKLEYEAAQRLSEKGFRAQTRLAQSKAEFEQAKAQLEVIKLDIQRTEIVSPIDGYVQTREVEEGDFLEVGTVIAKILDLKSGLVVGNISELKINDIEVGGKGKIRLISGLQAEGVIRYISKVADPKTRTFQIEVVFPNKEELVLEGQTAELTIPTTSSLLHIIAPSSLTLSDSGEIGVKIIDDNNIVRFKAIKIIDDNPKGVWVSGLNKEEKVIIVGQEFVSVGQKVVAVLVNS